MSRTATRAIDVLGLLTIAAYGSWFYGFGVLVQDMAGDLGVGVGVLGAVYGLTTLVGGVGAVVVGRILDQRGPRLILSVVGPVASVGYAASTLVSGVVPFCAIFALAGGAISASGFYSFTQPLAMSVRPDDTVRAVTRLTIWGAFASPVMIPINELMRDAWGWRGAVRGTSFFLIVCFVLSAIIIRVAPDSPAGSSAPMREVLRRASGLKFLLWYAGSVMMLSFAISSLLVFQVPVMKWAGLSSAAAASFAGARGLFQLIGRLPLVTLVSRYGAWRVQFVCRVAVIAGALALWASGSPVLSAAYVVIVGGSTGALAAVDGMVARDVLGSGDFATLLAILGFVGTLGSALGPVLVGFLVQWTGSLGVVPLVVCAGAFASARLQIQAGHSRSMDRR